MFSYILFDLDGTISDPKAGITGCVQYALRSFGIEEPNADRLEPFIGPPLRDSFMKYYGFTREQAEAAVAKYRERFSVSGKYENVLYPGMEELLRDLQAAGAHLAVASSKPGVFVEDILQYFGIRSYFDIVVGSELDGTRDRKEEVVEEVLRLFAKEGASDHSDVVMIGDRKYDIEGAKAHGTHSIGVAYGYAQQGELQAAGAEIVVQDVEGLRRVLLGYRPAAQRVAEPDREVPPAAASYGPRQPELSGRPAGQAVFWGQASGQPKNLSQSAGAPEYQGQPSGQSQGVFSGGGGRQSCGPRTETRAKKALKALGVSLLAMGLYFVISIVVSGIVMTAALLTQRMGAGGSYNFWINLSSAAGTIASFAACYGIWYRQIRVRPIKRVDGLSLLPMAILAAALAVGMNGLLTLLELYKYSPTFQEVSQLQFDIPVWLGIIVYGVLAPLAEETLFRGVVYGQMKKAFNIPAAILISGLAFGLFHGNLVQFFYASALGIVLALVYELYGTILAPMLFHGIANLFVYVLLDLTDFGGIFLVPISCAFFLLIAAVSLILMVKWQRSAARA